MTTPVFNLNQFIDVGMQDNPVFSNVNVDLGDGYYISGNHNQAFSGADGLGGVTSHKGLRKFSVPLQMMDYATGDVTKAVNILEKLYQDTLGGLSSFYFYNPKETATVDLTGAATTGRYLVKFDSVDPTEWFAPQRHRITLHFSEKRS